MLSRPMVKVTFEQSLKRDEQYSLPEQYCSSQREYQCSGSVVCVTFTIRKRFSNYY